MNESELNNQELPLKAAFLAVLLCTLFGANAIAIKITFSGIGAFTSGALRFGIASLILTLWAVATGRSFKINKEQLRQILIISIAFFFQLSLIYKCFSKTHASRGTLIINLQPFFILFLAHIFIPEDRITIRKFFGIILGFLGIVFIFFEDEGITSDFRVGDLFILISTFIWACNTVYTKKVIHNFRPFQIALYPMIFSFPLMFLEALLWDKVMIINLEPEAVSGLIYQSLVSASIGLVLWNKLLSKYGAVALHSFVFIMPLAGVLLGGLILGEPITFKIITALILIMAGLLIIHVRQHRFPPVSPAGGNI